MAIAGINAAANRAVVQQLRTANTEVSSALARLDTGGFDRKVARHIHAASAAGREALDGAAALGRGGIDGAAHRHTMHAARELTSAATMAARRSGPGSADALTILRTKLASSEVHTRLAADAGERSLSAGSSRAATTQARAAVASTGEGATNSGPAWVDGQYLDELGNTPRGNGAATYVGHDGQAFGWDGGAVERSSGGFSGPDGFTAYDGI